MIPATISNSVSTATSPASNAPSESFIPILTLRRGATVWGMVGVSEALRKLHLVGKVKVWGLGLPSETKTYLLDGSVSGLYLWQERRLKQRARTVLRLPAPSLAALDRVAVRTIAVALPALTLGIVVGVVRLARSGNGLDALIAVTLLTWLVYAGYLALRVSGWHGRRAAYVALAGFALVIVVRLGLPVTHFG